MGGGAAGMREKEKEPEPEEREEEAEAEEEEEEEEEAGKTRISSSHRRGISRLPGRVRAAAGPAGGLQPHR